MKALQLAAVLLTVCVSGAVALRCNRCIPYSFSRSCYSTVETCQSTDEVCATIVTTACRYSYFRRCMKRSDAGILQSFNFYVYMCSTDLCN